MTSVALALPLLFATGCFASFPRWFLRRKAEDALWSLRDHLIDEIISGTLSSNDETLNTASRIDQLARCLPSTRPHEVLLLRRWLTKNVANAAPHGPRAFDRPGTDHRLHQYEDRADMIASRWLLTGSWLGLATLGWTFIISRLPTAARTHHYRRLVVGTPEVSLERRLPQGWASSYLNSDRTGQPRPSLTIAA
jgi:hypothetical protein